MKKRSNIKKQDLQDHIKVGKIVIDDDPRLAVPDGYGQLPIDILEKDSEVLVVTPIAGMDLDKTEIVVRDDVLTIKGERLPDLKTFSYTDDDRQTEECFWGRFARSVLLPAHVDANKIEATEKDHILYVRIPKKSGISMRIVRIKSA